MTGRTIEFINYLESLAATLNASLAPLVLRDDCRLHLFTLAGLIGLTASAIPEVAGCKLGGFLLHKARASERVARAEFSGVEYGVFRGDHQRNKDKLAFGRQLVEQALESGKLTEDPSGSWRTLWKCVTATLWCLTLQAPDALAPGVGEEGRAVHPQVVQSELV